MSTTSEPRPPRTCGPGGIKKGEVRNPLGIGGTKKGEVRNPLGLGGPPKKEPPPNAAQLVRQLAAAGWRSNDIGREVCAASPEQFRRMQEDHPELAAALDAGYGDLHNALVDGLMKAAAKGNFVPAIFLLKSRFAYSESDPADSRPIINITLPGAASLDDFKGLTLEHAEALALPAKVRRG